MLNIKQMIKSENGIFLFSIVLGLGFAGLFKMSCDSRSCIIYKAPDLNKMRQVKVNDKCYDVSEEMVDCDKANGEEKILM
tara:strand:- start:23789 stop:24028 length:240 start_codon:yes stop_codon:yes gene_type:complete